MMTSRASQEYVSMPSSMVFSVFIFLRSIINAFVPVELCRKLFFYVLKGICRFFMLNLDPLVN